MNQILPGFSDGFAFALKLWLFFLICLVLLQYPVPFSILVSAVGGFAGGWVFTWWKSKEGPLASTSEDEEKVEEIPVKAKGLSLAKQRKEARTKKRTPRRANPLSGFFKK
ncbi:MAG TPA: hypothetical protein DCL61_18440 [Cyanobacteria bacterium UBA12227]|nr:hypothetical protein [Cyanobacteria bacterium UBA12227]HAX89434.1 hypothetical protein [Cyanobacteria bacterium UBA11370]